VNIFFSCSAGVPDERIQKGRLCPRRNARHSQLSKSAQQSAQCSLIRKVHGGLVVGILFCVCDKRLMLEHADNSFRKNICPEPHRFGTERFHYSTVDFACQVFFGKFMPNPQFSLKSAHTVSAA
jgi:hypothetical protein